MSSQPTCIAVLIFFLILFGLPLNSFSADPIHLQQDDFNGLYIGKHVESLNEEELFQSLSAQWNVDAMFKAKMLSGKLHSDHAIIFEQEQIPDVYRALLTQRNLQQPTVSIDWGINDLLTSEMDRKFKKIKRDIFILNFMPHSHWLRFQIHNPDHEPAALILELDKHLFGNMDIYIPTGDGFTVKYFDFIQNINAREFAYKHFATALRVNPGLNSYYLRVDSWFADLVPLRIWTQQGFQKHTLADNAFLGIIVGLFLFIIVYTLSTFLFIHDLSYIYLALMTFCALISHLCVSGFGFQFIWPHNPQWSVSGLYLKFPLSFVFFLLFCRTFLETGKYTPKFDKFMVVMIVFFILIFISFFVLPLHIRSFMLLFLVCSDYCFYLPVLFPVLVVIKKGNRAGIYVLIGISFFFMAFVEWILSSLDIIPYQLINYLHLKGVSFFIIMALGLFDKVNGLKNALVDVNVNLERKVISRTAELETANAKLTALNTLKTKFFANISHELRTPLTLMKTPLEAILNGEYGEISNRIRNILESMQRNSHNLLNLINNLLDFAKNEAGKMVAKKKIYNISQLIADCVSQMQSMAIRESIHLAFEDQTKGLRAVIDPDLMEKAIFNLLSNAVKFNRSNGFIRVVLKKEHDKVMPNLLYSA